MLLPLPPFARLYQLSLRREGPILVPEEIRAAARLGTNPKAGDRGEFVSNWRARQDSNL
jgi:hypothetical protein